MVHVGSADHRARHLLLRPQRACRARGVHRHHRPQLPPAGRGPGLRQQPGCPYVASHDPPGEVSVKYNRPRPRGRPSSGPARPKALVMSLLELRGIGMEYGAITALAEVDVTVASGEIVGLIGDNGAGKSTLVKII